MPSGRDLSRPFRLLSLLAALLMVGAGCTPGDGDGAGDVAADGPPEELPADAPFRESPWWPYLSAHVDAEPVDLVGGPITVEASQEEGTVNWVLPGKRRLDPTVFGTAEEPKGTELPAPLIGVPPPAREAAEGGVSRRPCPPPSRTRPNRSRGRWR